MTGHGGSGEWQGMAVYGWCCVYIVDCMAAEWNGIQSGQERHSRKEARYTNATMGILVYDMRTQYTPAIARASQRPDACIARARALYYYIIILL